MYNSKFEAALLKMPKYFTSNEFTNELRKQGANERYIKTFQPKFLKEHCVQAETKRTWYKKGAEVIPSARKTKKVGLIRKFINWLY